MSLIIIALLQHTDRVSVVRWMVKMTSRCCAVVVVFVVASTSDSD